MTDASVERRDNIAGEAWDDDAGTARVRRRRGRRQRHVGTFRVLMQPGGPLPSSGCGVIIVVLVYNLVNEDY